MSARVLVLALLVAVGTCSPCLVNIKTMPSGISRSKRKKNPRPVKTTAEKAAAAIKTTAQKAAAAIKKDYEDQSDQLDTVTALLSELDMTPQTYNTHLRHKATKADTVRILDLKSIPDELLCDGEAFRQHYVVSKKVEDSRRQCVLHASLY